MSGRPDIAAWRVRYVDEGVKRNTFAFGSNGLMTDRAGADAPGPTRGSAPTGLGGAGCCNDARTTSPWSGCQPSRSALRLGLAVAPSNAAGAEAGSRTSPAGWFGESVERGRDDFITLAAS